MKKILLVPAVIIPVLVAAYFLFPSDGNSVVSSCIARCKQVVASGADISSGPCLSDNIERDWVCDMSSNPRTPMDNLPDNQCTSFRQGNAKHFVEVDANCEVVRVY